MAAPEYVPTTLQSLPRRGLSLPPARAWRQTRSSDIRDAQPSGPGFGAQGPDQGYGLTLLPLFRDRLHLGEGEHLDDVEAGCIGVALKRASLFGRAPVVYDLEAAYTIWGYLDASPPPELVALRRELFQAAAEEYWDQREIVDMVVEDVLRLTPGEIRNHHDANWASLLRAQGQA